MKLSVSWEQTEQSAPDGVVSAGLGPLHHRHPLVVVAEERQVQVGAAAVGLGADGQLAQQATHRLRVPPVLGVDDGVFEPAGGDEVTRRGSKRKNLICPDFICSFSFYLNKTFSAQTYIL